MYQLANLYKILHLDKETGRDIACGGGKSGITRDKMDSELMNDVTKKTRPFGSNLKQAV